MAQKNHKLLDHRWVRDAEIAAKIEEYNQVIPDGLDTFLMPCPVTRGRFLEILQQSIDTGIPVDYEKEFGFDPLETENGVVVLR